MEFYLKNYLDILINTEDIEVVKQFLPSITLDGTNQIIDILLDGLKEEFDLAVECEDIKYQIHLEQVMELLKNCKEQEPIIEESKSPQNILIFGPNFMKSVKELEDSQNYKPILTAVENLESKKWMEDNINNTSKYKRLHGVAKGLSEVKVFPIRLTHTMINADFWYVAEVMDKEGNNTRKQQETLKRVCESSKEAVNDIKKRFTKDGKIDYEQLKKYAEESKSGIIEELNKWEVKNERKNI